MLIFFMFFSLCFVCFYYLGSDEWMMIAEQLGLTPEEIRFLDKRTLDPAAAALSYVSKQRIISVGLLYDLLNESGLPLLADFL